MEYGNVDRFMKDTGLAQDPAFDYLHFLNEPIRATLGDLRILGLYYPEAGKDAYGYLPPSTIHLPPDASISTLLHELGHRHGDYYYNDISEKYAEDWRKAMEAEIFGLTGEPVAQVSLLPSINPLKIVGGVLLAAGAISLVIGASKL